MIILKRRSKVKFTVTQKCYVTLHHPKKHSHTEFGIPTLKSIGEMYQTQCQMPNLGFPSQVIQEICSGHDYSKNWVRDQGHSDPKIVCDIPPYQDASTHQIWVSYLQESRRYAPHSMPIPETRSKVKVKVTQQWYVTLCHPKIHPHTKFRIPTSKNIGDMHQTQCRF